MAQTHMWNPPRFNLGYESHTFAIDWWKQNFGDDNVVTWEKFAPLFPPELNIESMRTKLCISACTKKSYLDLKYGDQQELIYGVSKSEFYNCCDVFKEYFIDAPNSQYKNLPEKIREISQVIYLGNRQLPFPPLKYNEFTVIVSSGWELILHTDTRNPDLLTRIPIIRSGNGRMGFRDWCDMMVTDNNDMQDQTKMESIKKDGWEQRYKSVYKKIKESTYESLEQLIEQWSHLVGSKYLTDLNFNDNKYHMEQANTDYNHEETYLFDDTSKKYTFVNANKQSMWTVMKTIMVRPGTDMCYINGVDLPAIVGSVDQDDMKTDFSLKTNNYGRRQPCHPVTVSTTRDLHVSVKVVDINMHFTITPQMLTQYNTMYIARDGIYFSIY